MTQNVGIKKVFKQPLNANVASDFEGVGTLRFEGECAYKWVQFSGTNAVAAGDAVCYIAANANETIVNGAQSAFPAGIAMAAAASGSVSYGYIQIKGPSNLNGNNTSWTVPGTLGQALTSVGAVYPALAVNAAVTSPVCAFTNVPGAAGTGIISCAFPW